MQIFAGKKFENPIKIIKAFDNESFVEAFSEIENLRKRPNYYLLGYIRYEAKEVFLGNEIKSELPLLYFEVYCHCEEGQSPDAAIQGNNFGLLHCVRNDAMIDYATYKNSVEQIKEEIACGNTYQVNYTYDYKVETDMDGFELYQSILPNQTTPYNTYIQNEYEEILCFSPELFFEIEGGTNKIKTKPMKGTVKRGKTEFEDRKNVEFLKNDIKNRAENVMIVDLLRNDLGKIAKTGTVKVDKLFEIETHKTVHQMTSEVSAELEDNITLYDIFEAIFPCGSVTGAPKINTMKIIDELEIGSRGVYCGAVGLISPKKTVFSVPIRTLQGKNGVYSCRVGGGIVWDSTAEEEWEETLTKIKFLTQQTRHPELVSGSHQQGNINKIQNVDFQLVETILTKDGKMQYEKKHFERMGKSAQKLGFKFNKSKINIKNKKDCILRILLSKDGEIETQCLPLENIKTNKIIISETPVNSKEPMLYHKTTYRPWYENAMEKIKAGQVFDEIFFNEKGELTEGARSNIVLQIDGELFTPPVECGLLNGVLRQKMLDEGNIKEKILYLEDLKKAEKVFCINSVRGLVEVEVKIDSNR